MATAAVGAATTSYRYDPASNLTQTTLPNGVVESATYDHAEQLTLLNDGFRMFGYGYDPAGNVNSRTVGGVTTTDSYDALDRLTDITAPTGTIHYGYDAVGNRTSMIDATGPTSYTYDVADELTAATAPGGTTSYGYDANGNETAAGQWTYAVNLANQLAAATNGTDSVNYAYDGDGNRTTSTSGGETTSLLWDANFALPQLALEADSGGGLIRRYSYGVGRISMTTPQATAYYSTDALGSVTEMSGDKGAILGSYDTNPFGDGTSSSNVDRRGWRRHGGWLLRLARFHGIHRDERQSIRRDLRRGIRVRRCTGQRGRNGLLRRYRKRRHRRICRYWRWRGCSRLGGFHEDDRSLFLRMPKIARKGS